jgi:hypothetical protein
MADRGGRHGEGQEHWRFALYHLACIEGGRGRVDAATDALRTFLDDWAGASAEIVPVRKARQRIARSAGPIAQNQAQDSACAPSWTGTGARR